MSELHEVYMQRALDLASRGIGFVNPNPMVGAVIVKNDEVIGEGYHTRFGASHAEIEALNHATQSVEGATLYVTLEPCSHYGKTPPCSLAIIRSGIQTVVIAMTDPNPVVNGNGIKALTSVGIKVITGVLEQEAQALNKVFIKTITTKTPYVLLKTAMSLDGKIATHTGNSQWISNEMSRGQVHELRHAFMGIMVGINTVLQDNPSLNCRLNGKPVKQPVKIIVDSQLRTPLDAKLWNDGHIIIATTSNTSIEDRQRYQDKGAELIITKGNQVDLQILMDKLYEKGFDSILLEGGATLNASAIEAEIVDEIWTFIAPKIIGGQNAPTSIGGQGIDMMNDAVTIHNMSAILSGHDILIKGFLNKNRSCKPSH